MSNYDVLIEKLDQFIRKFYINKTVRGVLYSIGLIGFLFLLINTIEYYAYFGTVGRKLLWYSFLSMSSLAVFGWIVWPLSKYFRLGSVISHEQAALIIGDHFGNVKDKLLNILQLKRQSNEDALVLASINQKSDEISLVPFKKAIDLSQNRKYLRYALPPLLLLVFILFVNSKLITDSTNRLINNSEEFKKDAPFSFVLPSEQDLNVVQFGDFLLEVGVEGTVLPEEIFIDVDNYQYRLAKNNNNTFSYQFSNVQQDLDFELFSGTVRSKEYELNVLEKPSILSFQIEIDYPSYTGRKDEALSNIGDIVVPVGTKLNWSFTSKNTTDISLRFNADSLTNLNRAGENLFQYNSRILKDATYKIFISNDLLPLADSVGYVISTIPDLNPTITAEKFADSTNATIMYFVGSASDDYGLNSLSFNFRIRSESGIQGPLQKVNIDSPSDKEVQFDFVWDLTTLQLNPGDEVTYYFEIFDNDAVHGNKFARTNLMSYKKASLEEIEEQTAENNEEIKKDLESAVKESRQIQEEMKKLREKLLQEKEVDWQTKKELEKLLDRQKELEETIEKAKENFQENLMNQEEYQETSPELIEKQEKMEELFEELVSDEMKELMEQIEELMQKLEKDQALDMMEDMEYDNEELEKELDRMMELFKQLEMEYELQQALEKLEELAKKQEELAEKTDTGAEENKELKEQQQEINEDFKKLQEKMEDLQEKNKELENPQNMEDSSEELQDIEQDLNESKEQLEKQNNKNASQKQKQAAQKMKQAADKMNQMMQQGNMEQMSEDMESLRQLLENLVTLSFDQESLMDEFSSTSSNTPRFVDLVQNQHKLKDDFVHIEDSLQALSKRIFQIESFVTEKVSEVKKEMSKSLRELEERRTRQAARHQQTIMQYTNDLALMLSEVMEQMQQQMSNNMPGSQMCNKPGQGKGNKGNKPMDKLTKGQKSLNDQMKQMKESLEKGKGGGSKEFAQMAAKQAALRKALRELKEQKQQQGQGGEQMKQLQDMIDQMNKVETDLVNKKLTNEMLKRQEEILTRLLEAENAEREKEKDEKRKSETALEQKRELPPSLKEYLKSREADIEMYKSVSPSLKPYYKFLVEEYFNSLKEK